MEITKEVIEKASMKYDGTCPFSNVGGECSWMSVIKCSTCNGSLEYRSMNAIRRIPDDK